MAINRADSRVRIKRSTVAGEGFSIPASVDHTDSTWVKGDLYVGELALNAQDNKLYIRTDNNIFSIPLGISGSSYNDIYFDAEDMTAPSTALSGATKENQVYSGTNSNESNVHTSYYSFDGAVGEYVQFKTKLPSNWNTAEKVNAKIYWDADQGASIGDGVVWKIKAASLGNDDSLTGETIFGPAITVADIVLLPEDVHIAPVASNIEVSGATIDDLVVFQVQRDPYHANDDMTEDAKLLGVAIQYRELVTPTSTW